MYVQKINVLTVNMVEIIILTRRNFSNPLLKCVLFIGRSLTDNGNNFAITAHDEV